MENILLPSKMSFVDGDGEHTSILTIEPLHHGYGTTVGNALRRVLLSSLEGAAVISFKIKGAQHEFTTVEGVKEDVLEIVMNLKKLRMKVHSSEPVKLELNISGKAGDVKASDIGKNADVEILNPDHIIATRTDDKAELAMEIIVANGRGYLPTEEREAEGVIGMMAIDAMFSPVVNVGLKVENTRVGEITNYDKLIMTIKTDGTVTPKEAVAQATKLIMNHFNWIDGQLSHGSLIEEKLAEAEEAKKEKENEEEGDE